ncbi:MAG: alpha-ketoacid dehydrogenase subunit beta [Halobacteriales archaeon]|nr:alpha-ketoacid dehydrogenase subunit beta [Halobacteriales archaeon]
MATDLRVIDAVRTVLADEMERDESVIVYGEDVGIDGGVFRATEGLIDEFPDQVHDFPLAEAGIIGVGVGLAAAGFIPVPEIQFQSFLYQGFHQLQQHVTRLRSRTRGTLTCPMTIRTPYGGGIRALEHHSESFEAGFAHLTGLKVVVPSTPANTKGLLTAAIRDPDPVVVLEPTKLYRATREAVPDDHVTPLGEAQLVAEGTDVTVIAWGSMRREAQRAIEDVNASVELVDLQTIWPLDLETILASVRKTGRCVVVHEAPRAAGMAADITARINDEAFYYLEAPIGRVTGYDVPIPLFAREDAYLPDADAIVRAVNRTLDA